MPTNIVKSEHFQMMAQMIDISQLLTETDAPFLTPYFGKRNEPAHIIEVIKKIAEIKQMTPEDVALREERVPGLIERLAKTLAVSSPEAFLTSVEYTAEDQQPEEYIVQTTNAVITEAAEHGNVVLVGRGAQACLARRHDTIHVRIVAPREDRIRAAEERLSVSRRDAERTVDSTDHDRIRYVMTHYGRDLEDPVNYDMVFNSSRMSHDQISDLIAHAVANH